MCLGIFKHSVGLVHCSAVFATAKLELYSNHNGSMGVFLIVGLISGQLSHFFPANHRKKFMPIIGKSCKNYNNGI